METLHNTNIKAALWSTQHFNARPHANGGCQRSLPGGFRACLESGKRKDAADLNHKIK